MVRLSGPRGAVLTELRLNLETIHGRIEAARQRGEHSADTVALIVVTKAMPPGVFGLLAAAGVTDIGENRVQAAAERRAASPPSLTWHGIGHLQRNKAATAIAVFDAFHALDSLRLADRLESVLASEDRCWPVYIQVNAAADPAKGGVRPPETLAFMKALEHHPHLQPRGFMTMARLDAGEAETRQTFATLRQVRDEVCAAGVGSAPPRGLSMGMSGDYELAVEEGATAVRVGTAVFEGLDPADPRWGAKKEGP